MGQPAMIVEMRPGTSKPSEGGGLVSGLGTFMPERLRPRLGDQFMGNLVKIHAFDWRAADLAEFGVPNQDAKQAARWQVGWWSRVWLEDTPSSSPLMTVAEKWLLANLPDTHELVFVHADYRTGNYLFDEDTAQVTAVLDWEFCHIGDYHEDLAWAINRLTGAFDADGTFLASGLMPREELLARYSTLTGRTVDAVTLHWYEVLLAYKCVAICIATSDRAVRLSGNHQEVLLTLLMAAGNVFLAELGRLLEECAL